MLLAEDNIPYVMQKRGYASKFPIYAPISGSVLPVVTLATKGLSSGASIANDGANYGPDTPGTVTGGLQEAVSYIIANGGGTIKVAGGRIPLTKFTNTTYRSVITVDSGMAVDAGQPIIVNIEGAVPANCNVLNGITTPNSYPSGSTVLDGSQLDVLQYGLYKQGRIFFVPPKPGTFAPINAIFLRITNMVIILPTYNAAGTGSPTYNMGGYGNWKLFVAGNVQPSNADHALFVNGIDAWAASSCQIESVDCISAIAGLNPDGNIYAGGGGVRPLGSAAGFVFPHTNNEGNCVARTLSTYDLPTAAVTAAHVSCDHLFCQSGRIAFYTTEGAHGGHFTTVNVQETSTVVQHQVLRQLTNSFTGSTPYDPRGDLYAFASMSFPAHAETCSLIIDNASMESPSNFLVDDSAHPLTLVANVEATGGITPLSIWGAGANLMVNFIDVSSNAQIVLNGTTAGTVTYSQSGTTPWDKRFVAYLNGYRNSTGVSQTITFVMAYNNSPAILKDDTSGATVSATTLTLPNSMGAPVTGYIMLGGY